MTAIKAVLAVAAAVSAGLYLRKRLAGAPDAPSPVPQRSDPPEPKPPTPEEPAGAAEVFFTDAPELPGREGAESVEELKSDLEGGD